MDNNNKMLTREDKLKFFGLDNNLSKKQLNDKLLDNMYDNAIKNIDNKKEQEKPKSGIYIKKSKYEKIDKNSEKYKITLEFLNALLKIMGKEEIKDITEFKDIKRQELLKPECIKVLDEYLDKIVEQFGKTVID